MSQSAREVEDILANRELMKLLRERFSNRGAIISLAGPDGSGKTTLAHQLVLVLGGAGLPVRSIHSYAWYMNLFVLPIRLAGFRRRNHIIILDRSIFDNVIELSRKINLPTSLLRLILKGLNKVYLSSDHRFLLTAPLDIYQSRRPEEDRAKLEVSQFLYMNLIPTAHFHRVETNEPMLHDLLNLICDKEPNPATESEWLNP